MRFTERGNAEVGGLHKVTLWVTICRPECGIQAFNQSKLNDIFLLTTFDLSITS